MEIIHMKKILSVLVENHAGVLARVSSLFCRRGYNIDSLTVSTTDNPDISRITIGVKVESNEDLQQIIKQTQKLQETKKVLLLVEDSIKRELLLVKVKADEQNRGYIREIAEIYKSKIVDLSAGSMVLELTGAPDKIDGFLKVLSDYEILEMCRTGITALERGDICRISDN